MAVRVSVREAAAKTISYTGSAAAAEEAGAAEEAAEAAEEAVLLEEELPQAVSTAEAPARPAAYRKLRREIRLFFIHFLL